MALHQLRIFTGTAHREFAVAIAHKLGVPLGNCDIKRFADGEIWVKFVENIRGNDVFLIQPTHPPADHLFELLLMVDAAKRASAQRITVVIPYFGYARQDRKDQPRVAISARLVADLISVAGVDRVLAMDLHAAQIQGFFNIPVDHLYAAPVFTDVIRHLNLDRLCVVSPDVGNIKIARAYAKRLNAELAMIDKRRTAHNVAEAMNILGDVRDRNVILIDDIVDTAGTLSAATKAVREAGAKSVQICCTHPVLSGEAIERLEVAKVDRMYVSDTLPLRIEKKPDWLHVASVATEFAEAIKRIHYNESISSLFD
ncbi:MAG: ribose-phosphate pyrophosphokinase [bacterium]|nr:ribose-phosphate pyrophosphokinase [bacterium]